MVRVLIIVVRVLIIVARVLAIVVRVLIIVVRVLIIVVRLLDGAQVRANALSDRIDVRLSTAGAAPLRAAFGEADGGADADFVMCNPPFFSCAEVLPT